MCVGDCIVAGVITWLTAAFDCELAVNTAAAIASATTAKTASRARLLGVEVKTLSPLICPLRAAAGDPSHVTDASCATLAQFSRQHPEIRQAGLKCQVVRALAAALVLALPATAASTAGGATNWATAAVSPGLVSQRATLTLKLHFVMTCGQPGVGPVRVQLPAKMQPMPTLAVRIGTAPTSATVAGDQVTIQLPRQHGYMCFVMGPGTLTLNLAGVRNPGSAGTYFVHAYLRGMAFTAQLAVRA
jgi:hypothetical protein